MKKQIYKNQFTFGEPKFEKFNRKTFNPEKSDTDLAILYKLRNKGWTRRVAYRILKESNSKLSFPADFFKVQSSAMWYLHLVTKPYDEKKHFNYKDKTFCDFGCGQSPDGLIALNWGFKKSYLIDLFKVRDDWGKNIEFIKSDICEKLPLEKNSIDCGVCQAVLDLMPVEDRVKFYQNAYKVIKKDGYLAVYIVNLKAGYGFNILREYENVMDAGFRLVRQFTDGFVVQKP